MKVVTQISCLQRFFESFSACANSSDRSCSFLFHSQRFVLLLDIRMASLSMDVGTVEDQVLLLAMSLRDYGE